MMLKTIHMTLAYITVAGFVLRAIWSFTAQSRLEQKWVKIAPHVIDTALLACGLLLVYNLSLDLTSPWLVAKFTGLLAYIGFGVLTLRGRGRVKLVGLAGALGSVLYIFLVAYSKSATVF